MTRTENLIYALMGILVTIALITGLVLVSGRVHADASARCEAAYLTSGSITVGCLTYLDDAEEAGRISGVTAALFD